MWWVDVVGGWGGGGGGVVVVVVVVGVGRNYWCEWVGRKGWGVGNCRVCSRFILHQLRHPDCHDGREWVGRHTMSNRQAGSALPMTSRDVLRAGNGLVAIRCPTGKREALCQGRHVMS